MTAANLSQFVSSHALKTVEAIAEPVSRGGDSTQRFSDMVTRATASAAEAPALAPPGVMDETAAKDRARRALDIDAPAPAAPGDGDAILHGIQKLRGVFDAQEARINGALSAPMTDANALFNVQMEMVRYSMLIEVSSKLTGKSTQSFETLLKGQ